MEYIVALVAAAVASGIAYATVNKEITDKIRFLRTQDIEEYISRPLSKLHRSALAAVVSVLTGVAAFRVATIAPDALGICKMLVILFCLGGAACVDYREHRIPNFFPAMMALCGIVLLVSGIILQQDGAVAYLTTGILSAVCCAIFLFLAALLSKQGIGAGDIKIVSALALTGGIYTVVGTLFFGITICCVTAVVCLITKQKTLSESLPFGPFLFLGLIISVLAGCF